MNYIINFLSKYLPYEIIFNIIIPFTYNVQSNKLLNDIKNYSISIEYLKNINPYKNNYYFNDYFIYKNNFNVIIKDIVITLINQPKSIFIKCIMKRLLLNKNKNDILIDNFLYKKYFKYNINKKFKIFWCLLEPIEREMCITFIESLYK
jgi:hypothetical protein